MRYCPGICDPACINKLYKAKRKHGKRDALNCWWAMLWQELHITLIPFKALYLTGNPTTSNPFGLYVLVIVMSAMRTDSEAAAESISLFLRLLSFPAIFSSNMCKLVFAYENKLIVCCCCFVYIPIFGGAISTNNFFTKNSSTKPHIAAPHNSVILEITWYPSAWVDGGIPPGVVSICAMEITNRRA